MMEQVPGALGTSASLALRLGQTIFCSASLLFMCLDVEFYSYTSFRPCHFSRWLRPAQVLVLQVSWSMLATHIAQQSYVVDISCLRLWLSCPGSFPLLQLSSIFGSFLLCSVSATSNPFFIHKNLVGKS
ncbi:CASP-like protein 5C3 isoform X2 [Durio zibethinus]|uniref:CASP-like protein 5C3 isoform X2 n=1 Tax=Durio zibethinus TaxID=66656 RepID=A0A6P5YH62_DURZI|nr:CASP-like protein 5C3 isoform X2 [Durio zibethinus]